MTLQNEKSYNSNNLDQFLTQIVALPDIFLELTLREGNNLESAIALQELVSRGNFDEWLIERTGDEGLNQAEILEISNRIKDVLYRLQKEGFFGSDTAATKEQPSNPYFEAFNSTYSEENLREKFAESSFELEKYILEVLHIQTTEIFEQTNIGTSKSYNNPKPRTNLKIFKEYLAEIDEIENKTKKYFVNLFGLALKTLDEGISDQFCKTIILKTLALDQLLTAITNSYEKYSEEQKNSQEAQRQIRQLRESYLAISTQSQVDRQTAQSLAKQAEEFQAKADELDRKAKEISDIIAQIQSKYPDNNSPKMAQPKPPLPVVENPHSDPVVLAQVAKRLLEQRPPEQKVQIITPDITTTIEPPVSQVDSLQLYQDLLTKEKQAQDGIVKAFEINLQTLEGNEFKEIFSEVEMMLHSKNISAYSFSQKLLSLIGVEYNLDENLIINLLPRLYNSLLERKKLANIDIENYEDTGEGEKLFQKIEDFKIPKCVYLSNKFKDQFESFISFNINKQCQDQICAFLEVIAKFEASGKKINVASLKHFIDYELKDSSFIPNSFAILKSLKYQSEGLDGHGKYMFDNANGRRLYVKDFEEKLEFYMYEDNFLGRH